MGKNLTDVVPCFWEVGLTSSLPCDHKLRALSFQHSRTRLLALTAPTPNNCQQLLRITTAHSICDGLHTSRQTPQTQRVQILWRRPQPAFALCSQTFLYPCGDSLLPYVDGVSYGPMHNLSCADLITHRPNLVSFLVPYISTRQSTPCSSSPADAYVTDHTIRLRLCSREFPDDALVYAYLGPGLSTMGICQLGNRPVPIPDIRCC